MATRSGANRAVRGADVRRTAARPPAAGTPRRTASGARRTAPSKAPAPRPTHPPPSGGNSETSSPGAEHPVAGGVHAVDEDDPGGAGLEAEALEDGAHRGGLARVERVSVRRSRARTRGRRRAAR